MDEALARKEPRWRRFRATALVAALATAALVLSACGGGGTTSAGGNEPPGKIGVILPDTASSSRWTTSDPRYLKQAFNEADVPFEIQNARGDAQQMQTIAEQMITGGVTVLAIVNLDSSSGAAIQRQAKQQGVQTIDYDRLTIGGEADYYVSFDNVEVGRELGRGLQECLGDTEADIAYLNGAPSDNNATLFAEGAHEVLDQVDAYTAVAEQAVPEWDNQQAATIFEQMWTQNQGDIDGVLAANDGLANAVISILEKNNAAGDVPVTGQDATVQGLQHVLAGDQCMTVYKPIQKEAQALADVAVTLLEGDQPQVSGTLTDPETDRQVNAVLLDPIGVSTDNIDVVVEDGFVAEDELCSGEYAAMCEEAGIS